LPIRRDANADRDTHRHCYSNGHGNRDGNRNSYGDCHRKAFADTKSDAVAKGQTNSGAPLVSPWSGS
jgi:hypothetical protein